METLKSFSMEPFRTPARSRRLAIDRRVDSAGAPENWLIGALAVTGASATNPTGERHVSRAPSTLVVGHSTCETPCLCAAAGRVLRGCDDGLLDRFHVSDHDDLTNVDDFANHDDLA